MIRTFAVILSCVIVSSGCSKASFKARYDLYQAEQHFWKANYSLRNQRVPFEARVPVYAQACQFYLRAFKVQPALFHSAKIEEAIQSCSDAGEADSAAVFEEYHAFYCQTHPKECEYGGDMVAGGLAEY